MQARKATGRPFQKGHKFCGKSRLGRPGKFTSLKNAFINAFQKTGGEDALADWGGKSWNKKDFYRIIGSMLPKDMHVSVEGAEALAESLQRARKRKNGGTAGDGEARP